MSIEYWEKIQETYLYGRDIQGRKLMLCEIGDVLVEFHQARCTWVDITIERWEAIKTKVLDALLPSSERSE